MRYSEFKQLAEAKFRKPVYMFHGTSSTRLNSIKTTGIHAAPKQKTWDDASAVEISGDQPSMASLFGSYWTSDVDVAYSSAENTVERYGGNILIVIAKIATQSAYADEDAIGRVEYELFKWIPAALGKYVDSWKTEYANDEVRNNLVTTIGEKIHKILTKNEKHPINFELMDQVITTFINRKIAHHDLEEFEYESRKPVDQAQLNALKQNIASAEQDYLNAKDALTRRYRESTLKYGYKHTLRYPLNVGFSGASHITHLIEIHNGNMTLHYGSRATIPTNFTAGLKKKVFREGTQVSESKFRKPTPGMLHGTATSRLNSILKTGISANPTEKVWDVDSSELASGHQSSMASLYGSYWTNDFGIAYFSAGRTVNKIGGARLIVVANIAIQSAYADEDNILRIVESELDKWTRNLLSGYVSTWEKKYQNTEIKDELIRIFSEYVHPNLTKNPKHPIDLNLFEKLVSAFINRKIAHYNLEEFKHEHSENDGVNRTQLQKFKNIIHDTEQKYTEAKELLTRRYRETAMDQDQYSATLRYPHDIAYAGASKITHLIEIGKDGSAILHYGDKRTIPDNVISGWKTLVSGEFNVIDG